jgi:DNA processing protein
LSTPAAGRPGPSREELAAWLRLLETPGLGRMAARRLLRAFGTPEAVFEAALPAWREVVSPAEADALARPSDTLNALVERTAQWLDGAADRAVIALGDPRFPQALLTTADPPLLLYAVGRPEHLNRPAVAVVGSRNPTPQGAANARTFAEALSRAGLTVVSGMALGIDAAAHEGALQGSAGTVAVVGTGLDRVYPKQHRDLAHRIAAHGVLVSEFPLGTPALPPHFPQRNRIIAGLGLGTLVVEAVLQSGSLITARQAVECGRDVFAVPGSIHSPLTRGCHALIKQGAKLVESTDDILAELRIVPRVAAGPAPDAGAAPPDTEAPDGEPPGGEDPVLEALGYDPMSLDALQARTGWPTAQLSAHLLSLELEGRVGRLPGPLFQRLANA